MANETTDNPEMPTQPFEVRDSPIQGRGAFATRRIRPGQLVTEYEGEVVDQETAFSRYDDDSMERHHTFLFALDDGSFIDAAVGGNDARFINHSCDPNCEAYEEEPGIVRVYATRNIQPGMEITYDYRLQRAGKPKKHWKNLYACHCGAPDCHGTMLITPLKESKKKRKGKKKDKGKSEKGAKKKGAKAKAKKK